MGNSTMLTIGIYSLFSQYYESSSHDNCDDNQVESNDQGQAGGDLERKKKGFQKKSM